jgi:uncharacterized protein
LKQVIFDSSFLMAVAETPTTWFEDVVGSVGRFEPVLPDCVRAELANLASKKGRKSQAARVSLQMASTFKALSSGGAKVDDEIVSAAISNGAMVATVDASLMRSLKSAHVRVVSLRSGRVAVG